MNESDALFLISAEYKGDYRVWCTFSTGESSLVDLNDFVHSAQIFKPLRDTNIFSNFRVDYTLIWNSNLDVAPEYLYFLAFENRKDLRETFINWGYLEVA